MSSLAKLTLSQKYLSHHPAKGQGISDIHGVSGPRQVTGPPMATAMNYLVHGTQRAMGLNQQRITSVGTLTEAGLCSVRRCQDV